MRDITEEDLHGTTGVRHELRFHDGSRRVIYAVEREVPFPEGALIVSRTDPKGVITHANQAFVDMSGYTEQELIGEQHCILRHPDMPAAAFQGLWDTLARGEKWAWLCEEPAQGRCLLLGLCDGRAQPPRWRSGGVHLGAAQAFAQPHRRRASAVSHALVVARKSRCPIASP